MDSLKELLKRKTLSTFRYATAIIWNTIGGALFSIFLLIENGKSKSDISCDAEFNDKDEVLKECFDEYEKKYTRFPVYGFVLINFFVVAIVPAIYSHFVKSKVNALETPQQPDVEGQQGNLVRKGLFTAYCCQLAAIIALAILFIILLQTQVFRPSVNFPSNFICDLSKKGSNSSALSSANVSVTKTDTLYPCHNTRATDKFGGSVALTVFNGICAFLAFIELVWILSRARNGIRFMEDFQFYVDHLRSSGDEADLPLITPDPRAELKEQLERLKDCIKEGTKQLHDLKQPIRPNQGEPGPEPKDLELDKIFVRLLLHEGRAGYDFPKDRQEQLKVFPKPKSEDSKYVSMQGIIDGHNKHVLLVGRPGIGKTILSTKLLRESAFNTFESQNFDAAFLVKFRHFNSRTNLNLRELLSLSETVQNLDDKVWNYIIENPSKVLLIFDGVDEFNAKKEISNDDSGFPDSEGKEMPLHCLYNKIASGKLLKGATVITTSRATAVPCLNMLTGVKVLEILGFTSEAIEEYVERFTDGKQNPKVNKNIWQHISSNTNLFTLCYVPVNCFIICSSLSWFCSRSLKLPTKLTKIYSIALKIFHFKHGRKCHKSHGALSDLTLKPLHELPAKCKKQFQELGKIAFKGLEDERLQFSSKEVKGREDYGLLNRLRDRQGPTSEDPNEAQYCFIHLTFQEFLAAYHVVNTKTETKALQKFIADHINHGSWNVVVQFLAGLLADADEAKQLQSGEIFSELLPTSTAEKKESLLLRDAQPVMTETATPCIQWPSGESEKELAITVVKCLYELDAKQQSLIKRKLKKIAFNEVNFSHWKLAPADCAAILHLLKNVDEKFGLILRANYLGDLGCMEIKKWTDEIKDNGGDCNLKRLDFGCNPKVEKGAKYLCDALKNVKRNLTELILDTNDLRDTEVELLSGVLKDEECELTTLNLEGNKIGAKGVQHLRDALKDNEHNKLTVLNLAANDIGKEGAQHLSDALKDVTCKLTVLNLTGTNLGEKGVEHLSDALKNVNCKLTVLNLTGTNLGEKGVEHLSDALKDENRKLLLSLSLSLRENSISDKGAKHLSDALKDVNCNLTELDLGMNHVGVKGAGHLSDALKDGKCKLTVLKLASNYIGKEGAQHLSDALKDVNCNLTELDLGVNHVGVKGAGHLSDALKDGKCKLTVLKLASNYIGKEGAQHLSDALKDVNCNLTELDLGVNHVGVKGAGHLSDALKDGKCKLTVLKLEGNNIEEEGAKHLSDALKDNEDNKLTVLDLAGNNIGKEGAQHLSDALKDITCKLTVLNLAFTNIGDKGVEHLSDALKDENRKLLPKLSLSLRGNSISDKGAKHLSDALKDVNCNLTELDLRLNDVGVKGAGQLSDALKDGKCKLTVLNLDQNNIRSKTPERCTYRC